MRRSPVPRRRCRDCRSPRHQACGWGLGRKMTGHQGRPCCRIAARSLEASAGASVRGSGPTSCAALARFRSAAVSPRAFWRSETRARRPRATPAAARRSRPRQHPRPSPQSYSRRRIERSSEINATFAEPFQSFWIGSSSVDPSCSAASCPLSARCSFAAIR